MNLLYARNTSSTLKSSLFNVESSLFCFAGDVTFYGENANTKK